MKKTDAKPGGSSLCEDPVQALKNIVERAYNPAPFPVLNSILEIKTASEWAWDAVLRPDPKQLFKSLWYEEEICCLFADSNLGKSILAVQIANEIAKDRKVIYFDFELSDKQFQLRYTDTRGVVYSFPENLLRAEIRPESTITGDFEQTIIESIEAAVSEYDAKVIIIDNLTWLCSNSEDGEFAGKLMMVLRQLRDRHGLSILVVAHTPKRSLMSPITQNDLAGSKKLFNFFGSVFAIGQSAKDSDLRYIKQIKTRMGSFEYGPENVIVCEIVKDNGFTSFRELCMAPEKAHLAESKDKELQVMANKVMELYNEGKTIREIADELEISKSKVSRLLNKQQQQQQ